MSDKEMIDIRLRFDEVFESYYETHHKDNTVIFVGNLKHQYRNETKGQVLNYIVGGGCPEYQKIKKDGQLVMCWFRYNKNILKISEEMQSERSKLIKYFKRTRRASNA